MDLTMRFTNMRELNSTYNVTSTTLSTQKTNESMITQMPQIKKVTATD